MHGCLRSRVHAWLSEEWSTRMLVLGVGCMHGCLRSGVHAWLSEEWGACMVV